MFEFLFFALFVGIILFFLFPGLRAWVLSKVMQSVQRRIVKQVEEQMRNASERQRSAYGSHSSGQRAREESEDYQRQGRGTPQSKLDMSDIAAKKFEQVKKEDYVDFEELPK